MNHSFILRNKSKLNGYIKWLKFVPFEGIWIHIEGESSPHFDGSGHVIGLDNGGTFINDMKAMLTAAQRHNIFVFPTLWNGAVNQNTHYRLDGLIRVCLNFYHFIWWR